MIEPNTELRKHLALDTDWLSAGLAVWALLVCLLVSAGSIWRVSTRSPITLGVSWYTTIVLLGCIWLGTTIRVRILRLGFFLLSLASASRTLLYLTHASVATQMLNAQVMRVVDAMACITFCIYLVQWFKTKIKYV